MPTISPIADLVIRLRERVESWGAVDWIADRTDATSVVVLFRRPKFSATQVEGVRIEIGQISEVDLDRVLLDAVVEIVGAGGLAVRLNVPWADGLVPDPEQVLWKGPAIAQSARYALRSLGSSAQGCEGTPL